MLVAMRQVFDVHTRSKRLVEPEPRSTRHDIRQWWARPERADQHDRATVDSLRRFRPSATTCGGHTDFGNRQPRQGDTRRSEQNVAVGRRCDPPRIQQGRPWSRPPRIGRHHPEESPCSCNAYCRVVGLAPSRLAGGVGLSTVCPHRPSVGAWIRFRALLSIARWR